MDQHEFDERFSRIQALYSAGDKSYQIKNEDDVWTNVGSTHLDNMFTELSALYLEADDNQRQMLYNFCGQQRAILENLYIYIRRIGKLISSPEDQQWLEFGIASALMEGGRIDYRDTIISLVLLRFVAETHDIDTKSVFDTFISSAPENMRSLLTNVKTHLPSDVHMTVQDFGAPEWVSESVRIYGEHNMLKSIDEMKELDRKSTL